MHTKYYVADNFLKRASIKSVIQYKMANDWR